MTAAGQTVELTRYRIPAGERARSDETTSSAANASAAQGDLPAAVAPTSTTRHGSGSRSGGWSSSARARTGVYQRRDHGLSSPAARPSRL